MAQGILPFGDGSEVHTESLFFNKKMFDGKILEHSMPVITGSIGTYVKLCEGETIDLPHPDYQLNGPLRHEGYEYSNTRDFHYKTRFAEGDTMNLSYNDTFIRYYVTNDIGTAYSESAVLKVSYSYERIVKKWDDVLIYNDYAHEVVAYQWYLDDKFLVGCVNQFCPIESNYSGYYRVELTLLGGGKQETCPLYVVGKSSAPAQISSYPNPAVSNQSFNLDVTGLSQEDLDGASLRVYEVSGRMVMNTTNVERANSLSLPEGVYIARLQTESGKVLTSKIMIGK